MAMARAHLTATLFIVLLAGHEAVRVSETEELVSAIQQQQQETLSEFEHANASVPDLDWPGCGKKSLFCNTEGCHRQYLWLDTPRQSCRFTDDYKLTHDQAKFLKVELARLEEKSAKFARTGCLFGGVLSLSYDTYMWKCIRRTHQMTRLARFVRKVVKAANDDPAHPAREYATSTAVQTALQRVGDNMANGFEKYEGDEGTGLAYAKAWKSLLDVKETSKQRGDKGTSSSVTLEEESAEQANVSAAMLELVGLELMDEQRAKLQEHIAADESANGGGSDAKEEEEMLDAMENDVQHTDFEGGIADTVAALPLSSDQREAFEEELQGQDPSNSSALVQGSAGTTVSSGKAGPIKWLFTHGLGWVVSRIAWLLMFIIGVALNIIVRGAGLVLGLISCILTSTLQWVFGDVIYKAGWQGQYWQAVAGIGRLGKCPGWAWNLVGLDRRHDGPLGPLVLDPARFASRVTGVGRVDPCASVDCGAHAICDRAQCFCDDGYYPSKKGPGCELLKTVSGCVCQWKWTESSMVVFTKSHFGCTKQGRCKVDQNHSSYMECKATLERGAWTAVEEDACYFRLLRSEIGPAKKDLEVSGSGRGRLQQEEANLTGTA